MALQKTKSETLPTRHPPYHTGCPGVYECNKLLNALKRIAYEPQGSADASHKEVLECVERIAKDAITHFETYYGKQVLGEQCDR